MTRPSTNQTAYKGGLQYDRLHRYTVRCGGVAKRIVDLTPLECERIVLAAQPNGFKRAELLKDLGDWDRYAKYYVFDALASGKLIAVWMEGEQS